MEAMWTRFLPHMVRIRSLLADGALGQVRAVYADHGQRFDFDPTSRGFAPELGGGALLDLGVYPVSLASMVLGDPSGIVAISEPTSTGVDFADLDAVAPPGRRSGRADLHDGGRLAGRRRDRRHRSPDRDRHDVVRPDDVPGDHDAPVR